MYSICEIIFLIDIVLIFFHEYINEENFKPIRDITMIFERYIRGEFIFDLLAIFPFNYYIQLYHPATEHDYNYSRLLFLLKLFRIRKATQLIQPRTFSKLVKQINDQRLKKIIKDQGERGGYEPTIDYNKIFTLIKINYIFKVFILAATIMGCSYILGIFWFIIAEIENHNKEFFRDSNNEDFIEAYNMEANDHFANCVVVVYYAFTTLSTVGFGDYHPKNDYERLLTSIILISGVSTFSYITGNFLEVVDNYKMVTAENEDADNLSRFFGLMKKYNNNRSLKKEQIQMIEEYFEYYWANDTNQFLSLESDQRFFDELPYHIKNEIYKNYLFKPFVRRFSKFFELPMNKLHKHSYYKWDHEKYSDFMIEIMKRLEPRRVKEKDIIYEELQEILEIIFVLKGSYFIGYEINKVKKMKLYFTLGTAIGAFNCVFFQKSMFIYKCKDEIEGYSIRRQRWLEVEEMYPNMIRELKVKIFSQYDKEIRTPLL